MLRQYELVDQVLNYDPNADEDLLNRAYIYTTKMHGGQKRASGDPYYSHPIEVAGILTGLRLDTATIITALLHDTIEDTDATYDDIRDMFGAEVAGLVDGVTKLGQFDLTSEETQQAENFRRLLIATSSDIRVLLVKLADRLHNMRTLHFIKLPEKRRRIAQETMDIFAPLAGRMGMQEFREELEDIAYKELNPEAYKTVLERLERTLAGSDKIIQDIEEGLRVRFAEHKLEAEVTSRGKRAYSVWRKMERKSISMEQLSDIIGFRIVVPEIEDCYRALGIAHTTWKMVPGRYKDYISTPRANGYQSLHTTVVGPENKRVELQIRTRKMHEVAEYGIAAHWFYKEKTETKNGEVKSPLPTGSSDAFNWLRQLVTMLEQGESAEEFLEHTKLELFNDQVFCFTPNGRLIALPSGATSLDFAYAVHTDIGSSCTMCRINGRHMPLRTQLANGDEVEIICSEDQTPLPAWEKMVVTGKARAAIRRAVRQRRKEEYVRLGRRIVESTFEQANLTLDDEILERTLVPLQRSSVEHLLMGIGYGEVTGEKVLDIAYPEEEREARRPRRLWRRRKPTRRNRQPVLINGIEPGLAVHFAEGSFLVPGDKIVGIVTPGRGLTVYPVDSSDLRVFDGDPERWIDISWNMFRSDDVLFTARLDLVIANEVGVLGAISTLIADYGGNISNLALTRRDNDFYGMVIDIDVKDVGHLNRIMSALKGLSKVNTVRRVQD
ncbi:MAG: bifunctional (p)ppGpp synthetase/guanosine-3',5'-bis(diphosphate) 3'-pyrophosphohydrolase [Parvularculales bacterium]